MEGCGTCGQAEARRRGDAGRRAAEARRRGDAGCREVETLELGCSLVRADFDAMARLEASFYGEDLITPAEEAWRWYEAYPFTTFAARSEPGGGGGMGEGDVPRHRGEPGKAAGEGGIVGFVNLFPVRREVFEATLAGAFNDADLVVGDVVDPFGSPGAPNCDSGAVGAPKAAAPLDMLLSCAAVAPEWQGTGLAYRLLAGAAAQYGSAARPIASVVIDTATFDGARFARRLGFAPVRPTDHGTQVWAHTWEGLLAAL